MFKTFIYTALALLAFAGNSVLCRWALEEQNIDAFSFTAIRLGSGAAMLMALVSLHSRITIQRLIGLGSWRSALALFCYAACFSYAYLVLNTGVGALILFAAVQLSMLFIARLQGRRQSLLECVGVLIAFIGLSILLWPKLQQPESLLACLMMAIAGSSWGIYTVRGKGSNTPLLDSCGNFLRTTPLWLLLLLLALPQLSASSLGIVLAIISGAITSAIGYAIWYAVLPALTVSSAAVIQLAVPVIAAAAGVVMLAEPLTLTLVIAAVLVLGGIYWTLRAAKRRGKAT